MHVHASCGPKRKMPSSIAWLVCLLGRWQPFHVWGLLPIRGSRPPSDLLTRHCVWPRVPGCVLSSFPYTPAVRTLVPGSDPSAFLCDGRCTGYCARGHQRLQLPQWRLAKEATSKVHHDGRTPEQVGGQGVG